MTYKLIPHDSLTREIYAARTVFARIMLDTPPEMSPRVILKTLRNSGYTALDSFAANRRKRGRHYDVYFRAHNAPTETLIATLTV